MANQKMVSLSDEVFDKVKEKGRKEKFNFSEWIDSEFRRQFMSISGHEKEIQFCNQRIDELTQEIKIIKNRNQTYRMNIVDSEKRFLSTVPNLIKKGFNWDANRKRFNTDFNRDFTLSEFQQIVRSIDDDNKRHLIDKFTAIKKQKNQPKKNKPRGIKK